uniref:E3 ubiquitin-protein ligase TRIM39-like n=1 Tax=Astyanax mexicanus TaxID=7994 RepID=A0A8B9GNJ9_ASTMX
IGLLSEDQFLCSICLDVFTDPVTTPCGHTFCMICIKTCWGDGQQCNCPLCKEKFTKRPELKVNTTLREVVDLFKKKRGLGNNEVLCDGCTGEKEKALKSCLDCVASLCKSHLESHYTIPRFKKHKLINPVNNLENYICQKHERPLELFCRDDQTFACQFCTVTEHKNHNTVPIEEESGQKKVRGCFIIYLKLKIRHGDTEQNLLDNPKRFTFYFNVLGKEGFSSGRFYYEVQVRGKTNWTLGVVRESVNRMGIPPTPQNGFWTLELKYGNEYTAGCDPPVLLPLRENPQKVGVFVDYEEGLVSFYDVEARSHIYSFTGQSFTEKLYPLFNPFNREGGKNSAPLIISPVSNTE